MKKYKIIISVITLFLSVLFVFYLESFFGVLSFFISLWIYAVIFYLITIIWRKLRAKEKPIFSVFLGGFLYSVSIIIIFLSTLLFWLAYYFNEINPAKMPEYTISNGEKIVKFQTMIHIANPSFYNKVKQNLIDFKKSSAVYFFEWVKPWTKENNEAFNKALWIKFDKDLYLNLSKLYWVSPQNNFIFLNQINDKDFNVDIWIDEIIKFYNIKTKNIETSKNSPIDANKEILKVLSNLNQRELKILVYFNQAILNALIWNKTILKNMENMNNKELFNVILDERNKILANEIINSKYKKIFVTYWKLHFDWVFEILKQNDKNWKITEIKYLYPIR